MGSSHSDDSKPIKGNSSGLKCSVNPSANLGKKDITIKCSIEEMTKAFFKDYVIVWHDPNLKSEENQKHLSNLQKFCEVFIFTEWGGAKDYIQGTQAVCHVITSGADGELLVKEIFESESVCNIYVFCGNKEYDSTWTQNFHKISGIEITIQDLFNQVQQNLLEWYKKTSSLKLNLPAFVPILDDTDKSEMNQGRRYLKVIQRVKNRERAKKDFLALSKAIYTDQKNRGFIADFDKDCNEYNKDFTLRWYTVESFLYQVTNNCLKIATSDSIQYCRLPLKDIEQAIKDQYQSKSKDFHGLLYRGAYLSEEEWLSLKENQDKEIEMHGFLSVSKEKSVAEGFVKEEDRGKKVLITILVPKGPNEAEQGFAEMEEYSQYPQEKEVLFNVGSRFTVLETEDDYEYAGGGGLKCRHLVLLYGAQEFRKFITEHNPAQNVLIPKVENVLCAHCHVKSVEMPERLLFVSIADGQNQGYYYCKTCIDYGNAPFLTISMRETVGKAYLTKVKGCLLMNRSQDEIAFYGYKCCNCQLKKQKHYFVCTDCSEQTKKWCEDCFEKADLGCMEVGHNIVLETSPFSFWCEKMSTNESRFQEDLVQRGIEIFQQAEMYFESHKYEKAIEYYSLYIENNKANPKDPNLATCYNNIANVCKNKGEDKKAIEYNLRFLDISRAIHGENHTSIASAYNNIAGVSYNQGEYRKALKYYLKCLDIEKSVYGDNSNEVAATYNNIGMVYKNQGEYKKSLESYLKSLGIRKAVYGGDDHPEVAHSYNNVGLVYRDLGDYKKALEYYLKSLDILKSVHEDDHSDIATAYNNIGGVYMVQGEYNEALEYILKSIDIQRSVHGGDDHPDIANSYNNVGLVYKNQREYNKALDYFLKALDIFKYMNNENHPSVATSYNNIGDVYKDQEEYTKAIEYFLTSLHIQESIYGGNHPSIAVSSNNLANVYFDQGEYKKALFYYSKCLDIEKSLYGDKNDGVAETYNKLGTVYRNLGLPKKALENYLKSVDILKSVYGENDQNPNIAGTYKNIGAVYRDQGNYKMALEYILKSLDIQKVVSGDDHPETMDLQDSINDIQRIMNQQGD